ncbi:hypothetical protein KY349_02505 [Candidatus Woesearchaeota archaeon]|nr:hypothetical protein [Candidatus Woesearchaeota archaeon]
MMDSAQLDKLPYAKFAEEFSIMIPDAAEERRGYRFVHDPLAGNGFEQIVNSINGLKLPDLHFMGIIGSVDKAFSYIANLNPKRAFLFDNKENKIPQLGLRLCLLKKSKNVSDNYFDMLCVPEGDRKTFMSAVDDHELQGLLKFYDPDPDKIAEQGSYFMNDIGYTHPSQHIRDVFTGEQSEKGVEMRKQYARECVQALARAENWLGERNAWSDQFNFVKLWQMTVGNRIRGFYADLYKGFRSSAKRLIEGYGIRNLVVSVSNIPEIEQRDKKKSGEPDRTLVDAFDDLPHSLDRLLVIEERENTQPNFFVWRPVQH